MMQTILAHYETGNGLEPINLFTVLYMLRKHQNATVRLAVTTTPDASPQEVYQGYLIYRGIYIDVSFEAPVGATPMEKDAAYTAALAQKAEIEYLAIGTN